MLLESAVARAWAHDPAVAIAPVIDFPVIRPLTEPFDRYAFAELAVSVGLTSADMAVLADDFPVPGPHRLSLLRVRMTPAAFRFLGAATDALGMASDDYGIASIQGSLAYAGALLNTLFQLRVHGLGGVSPHGDRLQHDPWDQYRVLLSDGNRRSLRFDGLGSYVIVNESLPPLLRRYSGGVPYRETDSAFIPFVGALAALPAYLTVAFGLLPLPDPRWSELLKVGDNCRYTRLGLAALASVPGDPLGLADRVLLDGI